MSCAGKTEATTQKTGGRLYKAVCIGGGGLEAIWNLIHSSQLIWEHHSLYSPWTGTEKLLSGNVLGGNLCGNIDHSLTLLTETQQSNFWKIAHSTSWFLLRKTACSTKTKRRQMGTFSYCDCYWADIVASNCGNKAHLYFYRVPKCLSNVILTNLSIAFKALKDATANRPLWFCIHGYNSPTQMHPICTRKMLVWPLTLSNSNSQRLLKVSSGECKELLCKISNKLQKAGAALIESLVSLGNLGDNCNSNGKLRWFPYLNYL